LLLSVTTLASFVALAEPARSAPDNRVTVAAAAGSVRATDGTAIAGATVTLSGNGPARRTTSDRTGHFAFASLPAGTYVISVNAPGYTALSGKTVAIANGTEAAVNVTLPVAQVSSLTEIGQVTANGAQALSTNAAPTVDIAAQPYAQAGVTGVSDILSEQLSTTVYPILGGGLNAPAVVALRGPDPSETLVDVDGHQVNNGSTGDFDLSLLDPADLQSIQVVYGIAPSALYGPNTLGGALNVRTLEPTADPHALFRSTTASYDTIGDTVQATGTTDHIGYAFSYHRITSGGEIQNQLIPTSDGTGVAPVSNALDATSLIGKLRYTFDNGAAFVGVTFRDQSVYRDLSATLSSEQTPANGAPGDTTVWSNYSGTTVASSNIAYDLDLQVPLGPAGAGGASPTTAIFRHQTSAVFQSVAGPGAGTSPYLYNNHDAITDDTLEIDHALPHGSLSLKYALTNEGLLTDFIPGVIFADAVAVAPPGLTPESTARADDDASTIPGASQQFLSQTERSLGLQYQLEPTAKLHYSVAAYDSNYTTFGRSLDPRFGFVWTPTASAAYRFSVGSTFQSPQLPTFIVPPVLPPPVDGYVSIGNPNATAERATSYDLGASHLFNGSAHPRLSLDLYRTDLHNGVATYYSPTQCQSGVDYGPNPPCLSYPVNVTREVYQGVELRGSMNLAARTTLEASYDIDSVYTQDEPATAADDVPLYQQSLGVPLHKATLDIAHAVNRGLSASVGLLYEGTYNELNLPPYITLKAGLTWHVHNADIGLYGTNLTNVYDFKFTQTGGGVPYGGLSGLIPTNAYPLAGRQITLSMAYHP
jgi:outer membrane receptor for ferrienterochelin and colicin